MGARTALGCEMKDDCGVHLIHAEQRVRGAVRVGFVLLVHYLCSWAGPCWFLECAGNCQCLGKPAGKCQEQKHNALEQSWNMCPEKPPLGPSWRPMQEL